MEWHLFRHLILSPRAGSLVRRIAFLSTGAIFLSVAAFLIVLFVMTGMNRSIENRVIALEPHLVLEKTGSAPEEAQAFLSELQAKPELISVPYETQDVILRSLDGQFQGAIARGLEAEGLRDFWLGIQRLQRRAVLGEDHGLNLWNPDDELQEGEALIGLDLARSLGLFDGDLVVVIAPESLLAAAGEAPKTERLRIKRVVTTELADLDAKLFLYAKGKSLRTWTDSLSRREGLEVRLADGLQASAVKASWGDKPGLQITTWNDRNSDLFFALLLEKLVIGTFLAMAGLVAGSSILTVMVLLLTQKRRDIALLRVLGLSGSQTVAIFSRIGFLLAGLGIVGGALLGLALGIYIEAHPLQVLPAHIYYDSTIPARVDLGLFVMTLLGASALAWMGAWLPSRSLSGLSPSDVLRQKK